MATPQHPWKAMNRQVQQTIPGADQFQLLIDGVIDYAIYMLTPDGHISTWNSGAQRIKGYRADEVLCQHFSLFYTEEDRRAGLPEKSLARAAREGRFETEAWRVRKDGTRFWANVVVDAIKDADGRLVGYAKITRDITERRLTQEALHESEQRFQLLVQGVTDYAIYMLAPDGTVTNWNSGAERIKGYSSADIVGQHFSRFYTDEDRAAGEPQRALDMALRDGRYERTGWRVRKDGTRFMANVTIQAVRDDSGKLVGFAKITRDITEQRQAEEMLEKTRAALFQSQKLEAVGKLTGGVAHDFNNVLQIIGGNLQLLQPWLAGNEQADRHLQLALEGVERASLLSTQLLAFARQQPLRPTVINPGRLVQGMMSLLRRALGDMVSVDTMIDGQLWNTCIDPHQLENLILNLAINSRDAMNGEGTLTIESGNVILDENYVAAEPELLPGQYVLLAVTDTGCGMPPEVLERAFEPFFTTKPHGQGTGLGLSMGYGFIKQSGGHIKIYSELGHGTTVKIYLPRSLDQEVEPDAPEPMEPVRGGSETILVVEDDPKVQATVVELLSGLGYRVLRADNAHSALSIIKSGIGIDLLFTDVVMPGPLHSRELAQLAKQHLPQLAVLFTSGYTQNAIMQDGRLESGIELLSKPYRREELALKVRQLLARERATAASVPPVSVPATSSGPALYSVLVVEDNADLRSMVCQVLEALGHRPHGAASGEEASALLREGNFDVLFADVTLPGMSGIELVRRALHDMPALKVILGTGHENIAQTHSDLRAQVLKKPFSIDALRDALENA